MAAPRGLAPRPVLPAHCFRSRGITVLPSFLYTQWCSRQESHLRQSALGERCSDKLSYGNVINNVNKAAHLVELLVGRPRLHEVLGDEEMPRHAPYDEETENDVAAKGGGFTAYELATRRKRHHPRLLKSVMGTAYEKPYLKQFNLPSKA